MRTLMSPRAGVREVLLSVLLVLAACHGDATGPRDISVTLTACVLGTTPAAKTCPATNLLPLQLVEVTAVATPSGAFPIDRIVVTAHGVITVSDTFVAQSPQPGTGVAVDTFFIPPALGTVTFNATASAGSVSAASQPVVVTIADTVPPVMTGVVLTPHDSLEPGDSIYVDITATDNAAVEGVVLRGVGVFAGVVDTLLQFTPSLSWRVGFRVPQAAAYGTTVSFQAHAFDLADLTSPVSTSPTLTLGDFTRPVISGANANGPPSEPLVPGDTLRGVMDAVDNHKLVWIGYRLGQPVVVQDSFAVTGSAGQYAFSGIVAQSWVGNGVLTLFTRDSSGNQGTFNLAFRVLDAVRKPIRNSGSQAGIQDLRYDAKRNTLYFMNTFTISVLPVSTMIFAAPIFLPTEARGGHMDLTPSSDSIVFANQVVMDSVFVVLTVVDLTQASPTVDTATHLARDQTNTWPAETGVVSTNRVFVPILSMTGFGEIRQFDLTAKTDTRRNDAGESGNFPTFVTFLPNQDRTRMAIFWNSVGQIYSSSADAFSTVVTLPSGNLGGPGSADSAGAHYLLGGTLLDGNLSLVRTFNYPSNPAFPNTVVLSAIAPDGTIAYFSQAVDGTDRALILKVRLSDNTVLQRILVPTILRSLLVLPDGNTLIGVAPDNTVYAVDLR